MRISFLNLPCCYGNEVYFMLQKYRSSVRKELLHADTSRITLVNYLCLSIQLQHPHSEHNSHCPIHCECTRLFRFHSHDKRHYPTIFFRYHQERSFLEELYKHVYIPVVDMLPWRHQDPNYHHKLFPTFHSGVPQDDQCH